MSRLELAHRAVEQLKRARDRRRTFAWSDFDACGNVQGLRTLLAARADPALRKLAADESAAVLDGDIRLFGRVWPKRGAWWAGDLWRLDPQTRRPWPGFDRFAFDAPYRGGGGEVKFVWELNRLLMLPALALHAAATGEPAPVFAVLRGWMAANPPFKGVNWGSGVEGAHRVASLLAALAFARPETAEDYLAVRRFLAAHAFWISRYPSRFSSANNHRVAELSARFLIGLSAPWLVSSAKLAKLKQQLEREIMRQFCEDGVGAEQSPAYAALSLEWFTLVALEAEADGRSFSSAFRQRAAAASDALAWLIDGDGRAPLIGDADNSRVLASGLAPEPRFVASVVALTRRWLGQPQPGRRDPALRDLGGETTAPAEPPTGRRIFTKGGLAIWRAPRADGDLLVVLDHGPLGQGTIAAHGHADALSVWLHWGEEAVFADAGSHLYHGAGALRDELRGTAAHNTLAVAGEDQSRIIGPFAWSRHARVSSLKTEGAWVEAAHDGYRRRFGVRHRRRVTVAGEAMLIEDWLDGARDCDWTLGFTLAPGTGVALEGAEARLRTAAGRHLTVTDEAGGEWTVEDTPYSPAFGILQTALRLGLRGRGRGRVARVSIRFHQQSPT